MNNETSFFSSDETNSDNPEQPGGVITWRVSVRRPHTWHPPTDLYETEEKFIIRVEIAGMNKEEFCVSLDNNNLTISGVRPDMPLKRSFQQMEILFGDFKTSVELPSPVDPDQVTAEYRDGFLNIHLPKTHPTIIQIKE